MERTLLAACVLRIVLWLNKPQLVNNFLKKRKIKKMENYRTIVDFIDMFVPSAYTCMHDSMNAINMPGVKNIIFNNNITKVIFTDGTWSLVRLSNNDTPNRETAILYAIAKRIYGRISRDRKNYGEAVESAIGNKLRKWVESAYDQEAAEKEKRAAEKAKVKAKAKTCTCSCVGACKVEEPYVRPDKPFSQFTAEEKRAYWREQNRKRKA